MNRKSLFAVLILTTILMATLMIGTASACRGQNKKEYVDYRFEAVLSDSAVNVDNTRFPLLVIDGVRLASGIQSCVVTINGEAYTYPEDFSYSETFHLETNAITGIGYLQVKTTLTFNLPGHPTLTEYLSGTMTRVGANTELDGTFYLTGTKMFHKVEGGGTEDSHGVEGVDYALHTGQMKGWPTHILKILDMAKLST